MPALTLAVWLLYSVPQPDGSLNRPASPGVTAGDFGLLASSLAAGSAGNRNRRSAADGQLTFAADADALPVAQEPACSEQLHKVMTRAATNVRFNMPLATACADDRERFCDEVQPVRRVSSPLPLRRSGAVYSAPCEGLAICGGWSHAAILGIIHRILSVATPDWHGTHRGCRGRLASSSVGLRFPDRCCRRAGLGARHPMPAGPS